MTDIPRKLEEVLYRMRRALADAGRPEDSARLVAVTKQRPVDDILALAAAGQVLFGENRIPELLEKQDFLAGRPAADWPAPHPPEWHFIGHVQTNKARKIVGRTALVHGVESLHLAQALQRAAEIGDTTVDILLEVNVSGEASKFGIPPAGLNELARALAPLDRVRCLGLMTMAPWEFLPEATRPVFRGLRECLDRLRQEGMDHLDLRHLSMGMTNDFRVALEEGATLIRVGTALFD